MCPGEESRRYRGARPERTYAPTATEPGSNKKKPGGLSAAGLTAGWRCLVWEAIFKWSSGRWETHWAAR